MKRMLIILLILLPLLTGCAAGASGTDIAATTLPAWEFTVRLCQGTDLKVTRLITENVSCLHNYSLNVMQAKAIEEARTVVISGAGLEDFMDDLLDGRKVINAASGIPLICDKTHGDHHHEHDHANDPHIWLSPALAEEMATNICNGLSKEFPQYQQQFSQNLLELKADLAALQAYGQESLKQLSCRNMITFHDGFSYFAQAFDLEILKAVEEESGCEASAKELIELIDLVRHHHLPAVFTEVNGSISAADVISRETGAQIHSLDMAMGGNSYFDAMYYNIATLKEAMK